MMQSSQLTEALTKNLITAPVFAGVVPSDHIPTAFPAPHEQERLYIVNTHPSHKPGEHWVALFFSPGGVLYYFDSYGSQSTRRLDLQRFKRVSPWKRRLQGLEQTCGLYCLCFALSVVGALDLNVFGDDLFFNDRLVRKLARERFRWNSV